ncbi:hypothetical protein KIL84_008553 [Mauremys mutica]|uniref:Uncharacterized protein n=1 Tax=Mauremys mutica TaxID=74926 RepID=A0A9D3X6U6_9SAUR|nr:hypothetical protein KIL84_008553 [Mauremys mutica]
MSASIVTQRQPPQLPERLSKFFQDMQVSAALLLGCTNKPSVDAVSCTLPNQMQPCLHTCTFRRVLRGRIDTDLAVAVRSAPSCVTHSSLLMQVGPTALRVSVFESPQNHGWSHELYLPGQRGSCDRERGGAVEY